MYSFDLGPIPTLLPYRTVMPYSVKGVSSITLKTASVILSDATGMLLCMSLTTTSKNPGSPPLRRQGTGFQAKLIELAVSSVWFRSATVPFGPAKQIK